MKKKLIITLLVVVFVILFFVPKEPFSDEEQMFTIEKGEGSRDIAYSLQKEGFIYWSSAFRIYVLTVGVSGNLQAGTYSLSPSMNIPQITQKLSKGDIAKETVTLIEGWTLRDMAEYFEKKGMFTADDFYEVTGKSLESGSMEGYLFPDTYLVNKGTGPKEVVSAMKSNFNLKVDPLMESIKEKGLDLKDVITMASLIEKEVQTKEDKEMVSGILWKRIKYGYPLQVDASIAYIKGVSQWRYSYDDTRIDSPYNTYLKYGLPPGPISNPGLDSIMAAINPKTSPYLYYLSTPEGETIYSRTLDEHNAAIAKYLK